MQDKKYRRIVILFAILIALIFYFLLSNNFFLRKNLEVPIVKNNYPREAVKYQNDNSGVIIKSSQNESPEQETAKTIIEFKNWAKKYNVTLQAVNLGVGDMYDNKYDPLVNNLSLEEIFDIGMAYNSLKELPDHLLKVFLKNQTLYFSTSRDRPYTVIKGNNLNTLMKVGDGIIYTQPLSKHNTIHEFGHLVGYHGIDPQYKYNNPEYEVFLTDYNRIFDTTGIHYPPAELPKGYLSIYSTGNKAENFAEHFAFYVESGADFRNKSKTDSLLAQKYNFLKNNVFEGKEY